MEEIGHFLARKYYRGMEAFTGPYPNWKTRIEAVQANGCWEGPGKLPIPEGINPPSLLDAAPN